MKKLFIDQEICDKCPECIIKCSYFYHPDNNGITSVRELAKYAVYCRKCEEGTCVRSCPREAIEKTADGVLKRYNMRCISCKSCSIACPFGTILPELLPFFVSQCDYCIERCGNKAPDCVPTCPYGALKFEDVTEKKENRIYRINDNLFVHSVQWERV